MFSRLSLVITLSLAFSSILAQNSGRFFINNFSRSEYGASLSNFKVVQSREGLIYVVNYDGILEYDGFDWRHIPIADNSIAMSIAISDHNRIYVGSKKDFGYLCPDRQGNLRYVSFREKIPLDITLNSIRHILCASDGVYFYSNEVIFKWDEWLETFQVWKAGDKNFSYAPFELEGKVYCFLKGNDLVQLTGNSEPVKVNHLDAVDLSAIMFIDQVAEKEYVIGTLKNGFFKLGDNTTQRIPGSVGTYLSKSLLSSGFKPSPENYLFSSLGSGIIKTNSDLDVQFVVDRSSGLQSNHIRDIMFDNQRQLWAAMQEGIATIDIQSPWLYWGKDQGVEGTVWDVEKFGDFIYIATTTGLYYESDGVFRKVDGINGKAWTLTSVHLEGGEDLLLAGGDEGLFYMLQNVPYEISDFLTVSKLAASASGDEVIVGHLNGLSVINLKDGVYNRNDVLRSPNNTFRSIYQEKDGTIWAASKFLGVYEVRPNAPPGENTTLYDEKAGLPDLSEINIVQHNDELLFTTGSGIFSPKREGTGKLIFEKNEAFIKTENKIISIASDAKGDYFLSYLDQERNERVEKYCKGENGTYHLVTAPFSRLPDMEIMMIRTDGDSLVWIAGTEGLFRFDQRIPQDYELPFNTLIRRVTTIDSALFNGAATLSPPEELVPSISASQQATSKIELDYRLNDITFEYSATNYIRQDKNEFSYFLDNNDEKWSPWTYGHKKEYSNLPAGNYNFFVKSRNIYGVEGKQASFSFVVLPPWYQTNWAYSIIGVLVGLFIWFIAMGYSYRVRKQRQRLKLIVADRTFEVISQKKEIEKQNDLLKTRHEEITRQKEDIENKNVLLNESQDKILTINKELTELNHSLEKKVENRTSRIKSTMEKLQQINSELDMFVYRASHDLKGPINRIHGLTALAKLESLDEKNARYYGLIEETTLEMETLLSKLTQVHDIINVHVSKEEVDLVALIHRAYESVKFLDRDSETTYSFDLDSGILLVSDAYLLTIIFKNLLDNALTFRKKLSPVRHEVKVSSYREGDTVVVKIFDNGIGIDPRYSGRIFEMFYRASDQSHGNGLGLYLVKLASEKLGIQVDFESEKGTYTEFKITIPYEP